MINFTRFIRQSRTPADFSSFCDCLFVAKVIAIDFAAFYMVVDKIAVEHQISAILGSPPPHISDLLMEFLFCFIL